MHTNVLLLIASVISCQSLHCNALIWLISQTSIFNLVISFTQPRCVPVLHALNFIFLG